MQAFIAEVSHEADEVGPSSSQQIGACGSAGKNLMYSGVRMQKNVLNRRSRTISGYATQ